MSFILLANSAIYLNHMTLDNFEKSFPANRLKNGLAYFRKGKVTSLEENEDGDWSATVVGTEEYEVEITMDGHKIYETSCTCPSHDEDDQCKHVAAVLYAINSEKDGETEQSENAEIPDKILSLLEELRPDELRTFLKSELQGNEKLIQSLAICGEYFLLCRGADDLARELTEKIEKFEKDGTIQKKHVPTIVKMADSYVDAAAVHWKKKEVKEAIDCLLAVTDVLAFQSEFLEDVQGTHRPVMLRAFQLMEEICKAEKVDDSIRDMLSDRAFEGAADPNIPLANYEVHWLDLIVKHDLAKEKQEEFIEILDAQLEKYKGSREDATRSRLLRLKLDYLGSNGKKREALKLLENNPSLANEKEQLLLSASKKNGEYKTIKQKMLTELELARVNGDKKQYESLQKLIVELMEGKSDVLELRKLAEQFYHETSDPVFFEAMKGTYMNSEWEQVKGRFVKPVNPLRKA
jgi:hypothetical protein